MSPPHGLQCLLCSNLGITHVGLSTVFSGGLSCFPVPCCFKARLVDLAAFVFLSVSDRINDAWLCLRRKMSRLSVMDWIGVQDSSMALNETRTSNPICRASGGGVAERRDPYPNCPSSWGSGFGRGSGRVPNKSCPAVDVWVVQVFLSLYGVLRPLRLFRLFKLSIFD